MRRCLNLGCGKLHKPSTPEDEWINLDQFEEAEPDVICDMTEGLPFEDNYFDHIEARACLGQIESNKDFRFVMNELWRVLDSKGNIFIYLPHKDYQHCYQDPFNQRRTNELHWQGFDVMSNQYIQHNSYYGFKPWRRVNVNTNKQGFLSVHMRPYK